MTKACLSTLTALFSFTFLFSQTFSGPESVEFDPINNRYIVSNASNGTLQSVIPGQSPTLFSADVDSPHGLAEYEGTMYVCDGGYVKGYSLTTAQLVFSLDLNGSFLNGICADGTGRLFVTDFSSKKIYVVDIADQTYDVAVANTGSTPNGILFDETNARLIFCTWGSSAKLVEVDTATFAMTPKITTSLSNFDGVVQDRCGNFLVSEWGSDKIYKIDSLFGAPTVVFSTGISNPADIYFNTLNDTLAVPNTSTNTVLFFDADFCTVEDTTSHASIQENESILLDVVSVQGQLMMKWKFSDYNASAMIDVTDIHGKKISSQLLGTAEKQENVLFISTENWSQGIYLVSIRSGNQLQTKKVFISH